MEHKTNKIKFFIFVATIILFWYLGSKLHIDTQAIRNILSRFPLVLSGIVYIFTYIAVSFFIWFSKDIFWIIAAVLFGPYWSALFVWIAEVINACILFYLARILGRGFVEHSLGEKYRRLDERLGNLSFSWLFLFRAAPLVPYRFLDLGAGLTPISFHKYIAAVILGSPFKIFWLQYIIAGVGEAILNNPKLVVEYFLRNQTIFIYSLVYPLSVLIVGWKIMRKD